MSDYERYGDYNEVDEAPSQNKTLKIIKLVAIFLCFFVAAALLFRVFTFNYYPKSMKTLYFNDTLTAYYNVTEGDIGAESQTWRNYGYDDPDEGNFFCSNLVVIREAGQLQVTVRYNTALMDKLAVRHGIDAPSPDDTAIYSFSLAGLRASDEIAEDSEDAAKPIDSTATVARTDSFLMYRYMRLVFDGIDFGSESDGDNLEWLRLEIKVSGTKESEPYKILIYQNNEGYSKFEEYKLKGGEAPI